MTEQARIESRSTSFQLTHHIAQQPGLHHPIPTPVSDATAAAASRIRSGSAKKPASTIRCRCPCPPATRTRPGRRGTSQSTGRRRYGVGVMGLLVDRLRQPPSIPPPIPPQTTHTRAGPLRPEAQVAVLGERGRRQGGLPPAAAPRHPRPLHRRPGPPPPGPVRGLRHAGVPCMCVGPCGMDGSVDWWMCCVFGSVPLVGGLGCVVHRRDGQPTRHNKQQRQPFDIVGEYVGRVVPPEKGGEYVATIDWEDRCVLALVDVSTSMGPLFVCVCTHTHMCMYPTHIHTWQAVRGWGRGDVGRGLCGMYVRLFTLDDGDRHTVVDPHKRP